MARKSSLGRMSYFLISRMNLVIEMMFGECFSLKMFWYSSRVLMNVHFLEQVRLEGHLDERHLALRRQGAQPQHHEPQELLKIFEVEKAFAKYLAEEKEELAEAEDLLDEEVLKEEIGNSGSVVYADELVKEDDGLLFVGIYQVVDQQHPQRLRSPLLQLAAHANRVLSHYPDH